MPMQITLDQLERWLDGQIAFGIKLHQDTPFLERFLADAKRREPDATLDPAIVSLGRYMTSCTAVELKRAIDNLKLRISDLDRPRRTYERRN